MSTSQAHSSRRQPTDRTSLTASSAKPPCDIHPEAIIADKASLAGVHKVTIGANTVLHPYSKVDSSLGPVEIGENCILCERAVIGIAQAHPSNESSSVQIGDSVRIDVGALVAARKVGRGTVIEAKARVGTGSTIGEFCKIASGCSVDAGDEIPDFTVIYGSNERRTDATTKGRSGIMDLKLKGQSMHIDTLRRLIPSNAAKWR